MFERPRLNLETVSNDKTNKKAGVPNAKVDPFRVAVVQPSGKGC